MDFQLAIVSSSNFYAHVNWMNDNETIWPLWPRNVTWRYTEQYFPIKATRSSFIMNDTVQKFHRKSNNKLYYTTIVILARICFTCDNSEHSSLWLIWHMTIFRTVVVRNDNSTGGERGGRCDSVVSLDKVWPNNFFAYYIDSRFDSSIDRTNRDFS